MPLEQLAGFSRPRDLLTRHCCLCPTCSPFLIGVGDSFSIGFWLYYSIVSLCSASVVLHRYIIDASQGVQCAEIADEGQAVAHSTKSPKAYYRSLLTPEDKMGVMSLLGGFKSFIFELLTRIFMHSEEVYESNRITAQIK